MLCRVHHREGNITEAIQYYVESLNICDDGILKHI